MSVSGSQHEEGENSILQQLWRLRHEDPTQYHTLVKMHLSFATDLPTHQCDGQGSEQNHTSRRWQLTPLIKKLGRTAAPVKGVMEGAPLTQEGVCQAFQLIHYLNKDSNIVQEGLFRKSGSLTRQQELKNLLNSGGDLNLDYGTYSAHDCASVLKSFLADLPEPLLTEGHYPIHCRIAEMGRRQLDSEQEALAQSRQVKALRLVFLLLPAENYQLLHDLLVLLHRVAAHQSQNLMSAINLGTMFAPHILCPRKMTPNDLQYLSGTLSTAVAFMIKQVPNMFQVPLELEYDVRQYWNNKKRMRHQLSKRSMMDAPAKTIFTFIDQELTAQANDKDVTEVALAELYAYVQSLPDSTKKRKLIKQFNNASGLGTPTLNQSITKKQEARSKRLGDSIKKVIMTPRSRCPIIFNSTTSLSSVSIPEEKNHQMLTPHSASDVSREDVHRSPVIINPKALLHSPRTGEDLVGLINQTTSSRNCVDEAVSDASEEESSENFQGSSKDKKGGEAKLSRWGSSSLRRTLSSAGSTSHLFGNFFRHLSTSSLAQLATRLTSSSNLQNVQAEEVVEEEEEETMEEDVESDGDMNESLSSVFKGYLLSRSILTDSPVDLSLQYNVSGPDEQVENFCFDESDDDEEDIDLNLADSANGNSQPQSKATSRQCSKAALKSVDSAVELYTKKDLSESLLFCLDGHNPLNSSALGRCNRLTKVCTCNSSTNCRSCLLSEEVEDVLHSCSPDGREQSLLKTKQGTPVPQWEKEEKTGLGSARGILFETSF